VYINKYILTNSNQDKSY